MNVPDNMRREEQLAIQYVYETEAFDRAICTGPMGRDGILPATPQERAASIEFARRLHKRIYDEINQVSLSSEAYSRYSRDWRHRPFDFTSDVYHCLKARGAFPAPAAVPKFPIDYGRNDSFWTL